MKLHPAHAKDNCPNRTRDKGSAIRRLARRAAENALVADAPRESVGVEALQQELCRAARDPEQVAEARERDPARSLALVDERRPRQLVRGGRHGQAIADANQAASLLEIAAELCVLDLHGVPGRLPQRGLQPLRLRLALAQGGGDAWEIDLGAAALEPEQRPDLRRPRLRRYELGEGQARVERRALRALRQTLARTRVKLFEPFGG